MNTINFFTPATREKHLNLREGETKFGEKLPHLSSLAALKATKAQYVILGIPEDIGIRGNYGKPGASSTWDSFLSSFLNIQVNQFNDSENCVILGHLCCAEFMAEAKNILAQEEEPEKKVGPIVEKIDTIVSHIIKSLIDMKKTPIIIGGGHNNAYGNIKGCAQGFGKPINVLNIDAHTDLRRTDYRHSGNGFSYAKKEGFLANYAMFGIHRNYTPQYIFETYKNNPEITICFLEDLLEEKGETAIDTAFKNSVDFLENSFGFEIDCDAISGFPSSAMSPSGFSTARIRHFIKQAKREKIHYLHLAEANATNNTQVGKALSYFVTDFIQ